MICGWFGQISSVSPLHGFLHSFRASSQITSVDQLSQKFVVIYSSATAVMCTKSRLQRIH